MQLARTDVEKVAALAKLELAEGELDAVGGKLRSVLEGVARLREVDTAGVGEMDIPSTCIRLRVRTSCYRACRARKR